MDFLPLPASLSSTVTPCCTQLTTLLQLRVNQRIESQLLSRLPPRLPPLDRPPLSSASMLLDHGLQVHLQTRSITASKFTLSWPPSAFLQSCSITASMCTSKLVQSRPASASPNLHDHGHQVYVLSRSITASKFA